MKNLHTVLVERGVATMRQAEEAMAKQVLYGGDLATYILEQVGLAQENALNQALAAFFRMEPADGGLLPPPTPQAAQVVPRDLALRHSFYPLSLDNKSLTVAVAAPLPEEVEGDLFFVLSVPARQIVTSRIRIRQALARDFALPLDPREQRTLAKIEGRPASPSTIPPPPGPMMAPPPSIRGRTPSPVAVSVATPTAGPEAPLEGRQPAWPQATRGLLRWMQRASQSPAAAPPRARRRRGPMPLGECEEGLGHATTGEETLQIFFDFAQQYFTYSALFIVQGDLAEGRDAYGPGADRGRVAGVGVPLDLPSCLAHARNRGAPVSVQLRREGLDAQLASDLKRSPGGAVFVLPVMVRQRCVALLYADDGDSSIELAHAAEVIAAASLAGQTLERLAVNRKRKQNTDAPPASPADGPIVSRKSTLAGMPAVQFSEAALQFSQNRQQKSLALARALGIQSELPRPAAPPPTLASPNIPGFDDSNPFRKITASFQAVVRPSLDEPVPDTVAAVPLARPTPVSGQSLRGASDAPEVQISEQSLDDDELVKAALQEMLAASERGYPVSERSDYRSPTHPPSEHTLKALPSIIVDLDEQQTSLVERLMASSADDDQTLGEVLREGVKMVPALLARQPGPLWVSREALLRGEVRPSQAGPLLRALVALRRTALPFLVVQSGNAQLETRLLATLLLGEFPYPEAVHGLVPRCFDGDPQVAQAALLSARLLRSTPAVYDQLSAELHRIAASNNEPAARKEKAQATLAALAS